MRIKSILLIVCISLSIQTNAQNSIPNVVSGKIERIEHFQSKYVTARNIDIWIPEKYSESATYSVLYMHDGQMLYDPSQSWNKQSWNIDDVASGLITKNIIKDFIVVGIWNGGETRHKDYFPQKPFEQMTQAEKDTVVTQLQRAGRTKDIFQPQSDNYLKFIVQELKPYIDKTFPVKTDKKNTFIAGSSMGGIISLYALCEYPKIFGGAACLSTHWPGTFTMENNPFPLSLMRYMSKKIPNPKNHKLYFDCGDQTLDAMYPKIQMGIDKIMKMKGYGNASWLTKYFPGDDHSEKSWNKRLDIPLKFLLAK